MNFNFNLRTDVSFGEKSLEKLLSVKGGNSFILTTPPIVKSGNYERVRSYIQGNIAYTADVESNPSTENINNIATKARDCKAEIIIALGGGSVMDTGKCVAALLTNGGDIQEYLEGREFNSRALPLYCIPTTSGTGSEVTNVAVITNKTKGYKRPLVSPYLQPSYALVAPSLTLTVPPHITAETGWDAFSHAIEAYWNTESNPVSDAIAKDAIGLILNNIVKAYCYGDDITARENMALGSLMAGIAFAATRTTALHGLSFHLTSRYGISHGRACIMTLLPVMSEVIEKNKEKMDILARSTGYKDASEMLKAIEIKLNDTGMATNLTQAGIPDDKIQEIVDEGLKNKIMYLTPIEVNREKIIELLRKKD